MTATAPTLPPLREVIRRHGLAARKSLGQHFLLDLNLIARASPAPPAPLERHQRDRDRARARAASPARFSSPAPPASSPSSATQRCVAALEELAAAYPGRLTVIAGDALEIDPATPGAGAAPDRRQPALQRRDAAAAALAAGRSPPIESLTLMFQKEVAERLAAEAAHARPMAGSRCWCSGCAR